MQTKCGFLFVAGTSCKDNGISEIDDNIILIKIVMPHITV